MSEEEARTEEGQEPETVEQETKVDEEAVDTAETQDETSEGEEEVLDSGEAGDGGDGDGDDSGESEGDEEVAPDKEAPELTDETEINLGDDETITLGELKEAHKVFEVAVERTKEVNQKIGQINQVIEALKERPIDSLLGIFTNVLGNEDKAYAHVVGLCEKVMVEHLKFEGMSDPEKELVRAKRENERLRQAQETAQQRQKQDEESAAELSMAQEISTEIKTALEAAKLDVDARAIAGVAEILLRADEAGIQIGMAQAVSKYQRVLEKKRKDFLAALKPEDLPEELAKKLKKKRIEAVKKPGAKKPKKVEREEDDSGMRVLGAADYNDFLDGKL